MLTAAILGSLPGCGEPPVEWPPSSPFPIHQIHFGMTFTELRRARPDIYVNEEDGTIEEAAAGVWLHYGFTSSRNGGPGRRSTLIYVDRVEPETNRGNAETRWASLTAGLAEELGVEPECSLLRNGRLTLRRAALLPINSPLAAAVEIHIETDAPGSEAAGVTTRMWLPEHASPLADRTRLPGAALPNWRACEDSPESPSTGAPP